MVKENLVPKHNGILLSPEINEMRPGEATQGDLCTVIESEKS